MAASGNPSKGEKPFTNTNVAVALFGASMMALGAFLPVLSLGAMEMTYVKGGDGDGVFVLFAALGVALFALLRARGFVIASSVAGLGVMAFGLYNAVTRIDELQAQLAQDLEGNPFGGFALAISESASLEWGWIVMIIGGLVAIIGALIQPDS
ncbi:MULTISPECIES: hypothetical protein [unclassified Guyparkeria]|uniref:hypothetical protein n=1 Tax=unclassified Guyparkeria TaxID=2626246 RepID=UPI00073360D2|nr:MULTISPECIES: hypothetical protein [unclassified Guyparkeria]KTG17750.1 hypothetical protein AUR63_06400 [Guyparkeria sp. XI15]OAE89461.1 hypothetical protein AWR35_06410 [Guyparkeria sp. WRN-7]